MAKTLKENIIFLGILLSAILFAYWGLPQTFYQQDEWAALGHIIAEGLSTLNLNLSWAQLLTGQGRVLSVPINFIFYNYFPLNIIPFAVFAVFMHILNSFLVFILVRKITRNYFMATVSGLFFGLGSISSQALSWPAASPQTLPAAFFCLLSLFFYFDFLEKKKNRQMYTSLVCIITAVLFKEYSLIIFLLFPLIYLLFSAQKPSISSLIKVHLPFLFYLIPVFLIKSFIFFSASTGGLLITTSSYVKEKIIFHTIFYPLESLSQVFIRGDILYPLADLFGRSNYLRIWGNTGAPVVTETMAADMLSLFFSFLILSIMGIIYLNNKALRRVIVFGVVLTLLSFLPYIILDKQTGYLESRHYYFAIFGSGLLFAIFFEFIRTGLVKRLKIPVNLTTILVLFFISLFLFQQVNYIRTEINSQVILAKERKHFLSSLNDLYPKLPNKPIFYISGDRDYYIPNNKVPFQQGMGYTLMVFYYKTGVISKELLSHDFLWIFPEQGYKEVDGKGFGYFWDLDKLKKEVYEKKLNANNIVAAFYEAKEMQLVDITEKTREQVKASSPGKLID